MKKPTLTVIMPVYNAGMRLRTAVQSILKQDFGDFELLLIDDGSTDAVTVNICEAYRKKDARIQVFSKKNEGIEKTKMFGIQKASGEYIVFSDHDDLYLPHAFSKLVNIISETNADIVAGNYYEQFFRFLPFRTKGFSIDQSKTLNHQEFMEGVYVNFFGVNIFNVSTWAKIYKSSLLKTIDFIALGYNTTEDVALNIQIFPKAEKVVLIKDYLYAHIRGGITSKPNPSLLLKNYDDLYQLKKKYIAQYQFTKAIPYINYEMKNILKHYVTMSVDAQFSKEKLISDLELFKKTKTFEEVAAFYKDNSNDDAFMKAYIASNYNALYDNALTEKRKITVRKVIKKILN